MLRLFFFIPFIFIFSCENKEEKEPSKKSLAEVLVTEVEEVEISDPIVFAGVLEPSIKVNLYGKTSGLVEKIYPKLGDKVSKNEKIMLINPGKIGFQAFFLRSPLEGVFTGSFVEEGEFVKVDEKLGVVARLDAFHVLTQASLEDLQFLKEGEELEVSFGEVSFDEKFKAKGVVKFISPVADSKLGTFKVHVELVCKALGNDCYQTLKAGTFAQLTLQTHLRMGVKVPAKFLRKGRSEALLMNKEGKATWVPVKIGKIYGEAIEVKSGLKKGDTLITSFSRAPKEGEDLVLKEREKREKVL